MTKSCAAGVEGDQAGPEGWLAGPEPAAGQHLGRTGQTGFGGGHAESSPQSPRPPCAGSTAAAGGGGACAGRGSGVRRQGGGGAGLSGSCGAVQESRATLCAGDLSLLFWILLISQ